MFGFGKPKALITIQRQTGAEEFTSIVVNAYRGDRKSIYDAIVEAGEALRLRLIDSNNFAAKVGKIEKALDPTNRKKGNK